MFESLPIQDLSIAPLTRDEFASALKKGMGRALLHVKRYGLNDVADLVLEACLYDQRYDMQCELERAPWLFEMFGSSALYPRFSAAILERLKSENKPDAESDELYQLCDLARVMAAHGDQSVRQGLRDMVIQNAIHATTNDGVGLGEWLEISGADEVLELARIYGRRLAANPADSFLDDNGYVFRDYETILCEGAEKDPEIKAFLEALEARGIFAVEPEFDLETRRRQITERMRQQYPLESILRMAREKQGEYSARFRRFGHHLTPEELETIYDHLLRESDPDVQTRLAWIISKMRLPRLDDAFFRWAEGDHDDLRDAAIVALAQVSDARVHALARSKAAAGKIKEPDHNALTLFLNNYESADAALILRALTVFAPTEDDAHGWGLDINHLAEWHNDPALAEVLEWVYENTPCSPCRGDAAANLHRVGRLGAERLLECRFDVDEYTRQHAREDWGGTASA